MRVYVLHSGDYEQRGISGVFSSPELAVEYARKNPKQFAAAGWVLRSHPEWEGVTPVDYYDIEEHGVDEMAQTNTERRTPLLSEEGSRELVEERDSRPVETPERRALLERVRDASQKTSCGRNRE